MSNWEILLNRYGHTKPYSSGNTSSTEFPNKLSTGWICPMCKNIYSPYQSYCPYCTGNRFREYGGNLWGWR